VSPPLQDADGNLRFGCPVAVVVINASVDNEGTVKYGEKQFPRGFVAYS
jgi:hypothetical protein